MSSTDDIDYNIVCECGDEFPNEELLKVHLKLKLNSTRTGCEIKQEKGCPYDVEDGSKVEIYDDHDTLVSTLSDDESGNCVSWDNENCARFINFHDTFIQEVVIETEEASNEFSPNDDIKKDIDIKSEEPVQVTVPSAGVVLNAVKHKRKRKPRQSQAEKTCLYCGKTFSSGPALISHLRIHTGEKPFVCDVCNKAFNQAHNLQTHMCIHTGVRPFPCHRCPKSFITQWALDRHFRSHTGEKPYKCEHCGKTFSQSSNKRSHFESVHLGKGWPKKKPKVKKIKTESEVSYDSDTSPPA